MVVQVEKQGICLPIMLIELLAWEWWQQAYVGHTRSSKAALQKRFLGAVTDQSETGLWA